MAKRIIINADDFGLKSSVNKAIVASFNTGIITSTTLMANMPGFNEAVELAHQNNILNKIGIHLNLTEGYPITGDIKKTSLFYNQYNLDLDKHKKNLFRLTINEKRIVINEFAAQIEKVKNAGIQITHIDTHHHIDEVWSITQIIMALLKKYSIPSMRILNNLNKSSSFYKKTYRKLVNKFIKINHANFTDYLGNQLEAATQLVNDPSFCDDKKLEIMVHPDYSSDGLIIDKIKNQEYTFEYPEELSTILSFQKGL
jgi:chitin disaccharide deacetylase